MNAIAPSVKTKRKAGVYRAAVLRILGRFRNGRLKITLPDGTVHCLGEGNGGPEASIWIGNEAFFRKCALKGGVGLGESYMDGDWETEDIAEVISWFIINLHADQHLRGSSQRFRWLGCLAFLDRRGHRRRENSRGNSRRNIEEHYDLGNDFYRLWLDPSMTYSSARFTEERQSLKNAQTSKYEALCQKLQLKPEDHVLEIGCGWGEFSCHAARHHGCRVTGVTISPSQHAEALRRVRQAGLAQRVDLQLRDYRDLDRQYDKIASIEMLEAVGHAYHPVWAGKCQELLRPEGLLGVQMITVPDSEYETLRRGTDFIQKHVFPGSLLLSVGRMGSVLSRAGGFYLHDLEDLGLSYARTLCEWHRKFNLEIDAVRELGFSERSIRKWSYYLKYCEAAFASRNISVVQAVYTRPEK